MCTQYTVFKLTNQVTWSLCSGTTTNLQQPIASILQRLNQTFMDMCNMSISSHDSEVPWNFFNEQKMLDIT